MQRDEPVAGKGGKAEEEARRHSIVEGFLLSHFCSDMCGVKTLPPFQRPREEFRHGVQLVDMIGRRVSGEAE